MRLIEYEDPKEARISTLANLFDMSDPVLQLGSQN